MATENTSIINQFAALTPAQEKLLDQGITFAPRLATALLILAVGYYLGVWVGRLLDKALTRFELDITIRLLLLRMTRLLVFALFLIMALQNLGVDLLPLIAGLGVAGAGVALAMQGVLSNLAAGLTIIFTHPYRVGEYLSIAHEEGVVENISLFSTTLSHLDRSRVVIPNRKIVGEILHNYGEIRQLDLAVGVAYDTDLGQVLVAVEEVLKANQRVLPEPLPLVQVAALADSSVTIGVRPWVKVPDYAAAIGELNRSLLERLREQGIRIPCPQREVRLLGTDN